MAKGRKLGSAQRGIAFSTINAMEVSVLIMIVGHGTYNSSEAFTVDRLAGLVEEWIGQVGVWIFAMGFVAAALSSMLAVPLGAALTADSVFSECEEESVGQYTNIGHQEEVEGEQEDKQHESRVMKALPRPVYWAIISAMVLISVVLISCDGQ